MKQIVARVFFNVPDDDELTVGDWNHRIAEAIEEAPVSYETPVRNVTVYVERIQEGVIS